MNQCGLLSIVAEKFPDCLSWINYCYGTKSVLVDRNYPIDSSDGVRQGDPLGPLLFALSLHLGEQHCNLYLPNLWYCDDGNFIGTYDEIDKTSSVNEYCYTTGSPYQFQKV